jgi:hypothetical protein
LEIDLVLPLPVRGTELSQFRIRQSLAPIKRLDLPLAHLEPDCDGTFLGLRASCHGEPQNQQRCFGDQAGEFHVIA